MVIGKRSLKINKSQIRIQQLLQHFPKKLMTILANTKQISIDKNKYNVKTFINQ